MPTASIVLCLLLVATITTSAAARHHHRHNNHGAAASLASADRVGRLAGQPSTEVGFRQFAGYVTVNETHGRALFYWFFEATHDVATKPLVLWLNGGPGCSSVGYGAMEEVGPFLIHNQKGSPQLTLNPQSWNKDANLLFVESPAGVGFSYSNTTADLTGFGDALAAHDAYTFLVKWFERFPQFKGHDFYIAGESYAGHYVPQLAEKIILENNNNRRRRIKLKGFMIGNAAIDAPSDDLGMVDYAWDHAIISDELFAAIHNHCTFVPNNHTATDDACHRAMDTFYHAFDHIDLYSIYTPFCIYHHHLLLHSRHGHAHAHALRYYNKYDPCLDNRVIDYLNRADVQRALHANVSGDNLPYRWAPCSHLLLDHWQDTPASTLPVIKRMVVDAGLRVWVYSGDTDARVPVTSTRYALRKLGLKTVRPWREWFTGGGQVGGYTVVYDGLTFVTVRGAGHMVPRGKPAQARQLLAHFLAGTEMPTPTPA